jgi:hypothetical protein
MPTHRISQSKPQLELQYCNRPQRSTKISASKTEIWVVSLGTTNHQIFAKGMEIGQISSIQNSNLVIKNGQISTFLAIQN